MNKRHPDRRATIAGPGSPLPGALRWLGWPLSAVYGSIIARRNRYWDRHAAARVDRAVISVGNLSAGGTGKTPVVSWLAQHLHDAGLRPAIAMRGYKSTRGEKCDEQLEHESRLAAVPVIADPDRHGAISRYLAAHDEIDVILLDDGFQHRRLHRDLDIVLIDTLRPPFRDALLPRGYLREPVASLARADVVALTRADLVSSDALTTLRSRIAQIVGQAPPVEFRSVWSWLDSSDAPEPRTIDWLQGRSFIAVCGIGHPDAFLAMAGRAGAQLADTIILPDHARYTPALLSGIAARARNTAGVLTTAKDWVKIKPVLEQQRINLAVHRPRLDFEATRGGDELISRVTAIVRQRLERS